MAFPRNLLNEREELVLDLRPHWFFLVRQALVLFVAVVFGIAVLAAMDSGDLKSTLSIVAGVAVVAALIWFGWSYAVWNTTMFVLTSDRIVTRRGVLSKQGVEIPLERVNTVFFKQSVFERILGSGDLAIESAGERGSEAFSNIRKPSIVQKEIYVQMEHNENRKFDRINPAQQAAQAAAPVAAAASTDATAVQGDIPAQIEKLAELHQRGVLSDAEYQHKKAELLERM